MTSSNLNSTPGLIDCFGSNLTTYSDSQTNATCHVCLSTGAVVGLSLQAQTGLISLAALLILLFVIVRNYIRSLKRPPQVRRRLFQVNLDILMFNVIVADLVMSFGAISNVRWAYDRQVYCGSYCNAQGILQTTGESAAALATLSVTVYTFLTVNLDRPLTYRPWFYIAMIGLTWLWCVLWPVILLKKYDEPGLEDGEVDYAFTPTPWWCWINHQYMPERILAEYLWLWIAGICSIGLYTPTYFIVRSRQRRAREAAPDGDRQIAANIVDQGDEAVKILLYPLAYTVCVLPLSIMRWWAFANPSLMDRPKSNRPLRPSGLSSI